ncbi:EPL1 domain-containing protein [Cinnamomum micranthum f. kanehirae]|uniref:Enhancer of polycomb-like protein n=1 Tax=Cinnamomum micranthum f. kanehirae TaxID=337451 RepID=A0A3S3NWD5_9MAGN|nr:EPL1 domain-containing protein [Cinnamomum micranthum f. kanehirae]
MSRLSFRPRPLDIHKKLPILKSLKDFEDDENSTSTRNSQIQRLSVEPENEVHHIPSKKNASEIPTPQFDIVDTYERDYSCTFSQPPSYLRGRGARAEIGEFVEYDLDNEDEDWLEEFNNERKIITPEKFEILLFKLEVLDHKTRERAGIIMATLVSPVPVLLELDIAFEALQSLSIRYPVFQSVYNYWKEKREQWQKPILRQLQPPPPVNDTNPYNVFRPREKAHRLHTRRMQRRENNVQSFEKLRQVRRNLDQAKTVIDALIKREEKKREVMETEVSLQRTQMKYKLVEDGLALPAPVPCRYGSSEDDFIDSEDMMIGLLRTQPATVRNLPFADSELMTVPMGRLKREFKRRSLPHEWIHKRDPDEPILLFTRPVDPEKLAAAGVVQPSDPPTENGATTPPYHFHGRIGRGGRIIFDRWNPLLRTPISNGSSLYLRNHRPPPPG